MKLPAEQTGGQKELTPEGNHVAVCYEVIDLGTQEVTYLDEVKQQRKVRIGWELSGELMEDGRPFVISRRYTFSSHEKSTMRRHLEAWRGRKFKPEDFGEGGFDIRKLIGVGCMLQVVHNTKQDRTFANVQSVGSLPKGMPAPELVNQPVYFSLETGEFDSTVLASLPDWMQEIIRKSPEFAALRKTRTVEDYVGEVEPAEYDDESPF